MVIHVVKAGESISSIAQQYGVSQASIIVNNEVATPTKLAVGQTLVILVAKFTHTVQAGESLLSIAGKYNVTVNQLYRNNIRLKGSDTIKVGETIVISYEDTPQNTMEVNAYAYTFINKTLLRQTLPYLTYLTPFTYGIKYDGGLVELDDKELIDAANTYQTAPLMHLSTLTEEGNFSNELASRVLTNPTIQAQLINNIIAMMQQKKYYGLDVDFEFISADEAPLYVAFVKNLATQLNPLGYEVIAALAPKVSSTQKGLLYEGHDYAGIGRAANAVLLMTYEWGYTYGPPMAVAPINKVREVLNYAITQIEPSKIYLGVPNYGYDWTLPYIQGTTKARSIGNQEAISIAVKYGATILFDQVAQAPYFNYVDEGGQRHEVWFEDARSIEKKLALVSEYKLRGVGYWNAMRPFPQNWLLLNAQYNIRRVV